jgi:sulfatase maturation enzyme AslB (radical SAM superfamily)
MKNNPLIKHVRKDIPDIFNEIEILKKHKNRLKHALTHDVILPPYEVIIHPSAICNLRCQWCIGGKILEEKKANKVCNILPSSLAKPENMERVIMNLINYRKKGFRIENV